MSRFSLRFTMATMRVRRERGPEEGERGASAGQVLVLFALMSTALMGILGLSVDIGYSMSQRRAMQNAADLAAIAGAHAVAEYRQDNVISASTSVQAVVDGNQTHEGSPAIKACEYVNDALSDVANCDFAVPANATGVRVETTETHDTFFIKVVPGAPSQVTTTAHATARVELLFRAGMDSPFLVCGYGAKLSDDSGSMDILLNDATVNPDAIGKTFRIVGDNVARPADADGDGLLDSDEQARGTNWQDPSVDFDTDGGGAPDGLEVRNGTNPKVAGDDYVDYDRDDDGLTDSEEVTNPDPSLRTDPDDWDTDGDKISDWAEINVYHTDPQDKNSGKGLKKDDKDGDGLTDVDEDARGTDSDKRDTDRGGVPDGVEVATGMDPLNAADDDGDTDGDGLSDSDEVNVYGTNRYVRDTDGGGVSDWAEVANGSAPTDGTDDFGTGVDEISNCGMTLVNSTGSVSTSLRDYATYNGTASAPLSNRAWLGFAQNKSSASPNNDDHRPNENWFGRKGRAAPAGQRFTVDGVEGCYGANQSDYPAVNANNFGSNIDDNCILLVPVASDASHGHAPTCPTMSANPSCTFYVTKVLAFKIAKISNTEFEARLLDDYPAFGGSYPGWTRDQGGVVVIKLKE